MTSLGTVWWRWRGALPPQRQASALRLGWSLTWGTRSRNLMLTAPPSDLQFIHLNYIRRQALRHPPEPTNPEPVTCGSSVRFCTVWRSEVQLAPHATIAAEEQDERGQAHGSEQAESR